MVHMTLMFLAVCCALLLADNVFMRLKERRLHALPWWKVTHEGSHEIVLVASIDYAQLRASIETDAHADSDTQTSICHIWKHEAFKGDDETRAVLKHWIFGDPLPFGKGMRGYEQNRYPKESRSAPPRKH